MMDERNLDVRTHGRTDGRTSATLYALPHSSNGGGIKIKPPLAGEHVFRLTVRAFGILPMVPVEILPMVPLVANGTVGNQRT